jgi:hypothetical protein
MVTRIATIVFLVAIGINLIWALAYTALIAGIAALIAAIAMVLEK